MAVVNYAAEYSRALANAYPYLSYYSRIWASNNSNLYKPGLGKTMYIPSLEVAGAHAVNHAVVKYLKLLWADLHFYLFRGSLNQVALPLSFPNEFKVDSVYIRECLGIRNELSIM